MKSNVEPLLQEMLADACPPDFQKTLLAAARRGARERRRARKINAMGAVVSVVLGAILWALPKPARLEVAVSPHPQSSFYVTSRPLRVDQIISSSSQPEVAEVQTSQTSGRYRFINDRELLALLPKSAQLLHRGPHEVELILPGASANSP